MLGGGGSRVVGSSGGGAAAAVAGPTAHDGGGNTNIFSTSTSNNNNNNSAGEEDKGGVNEGGGGSSGCNRWPRQETLALLQIRSGMDVAFRDASPKGPLWEEVSRKLAALGYHRSAKKCKEKFENVYKYHKRTKDGRPGKHDGKTYKFFDQMKALENHNYPIPPAAPIQALPPPPPPSNPPTLPPAVTVPSISIPSFAQNNITIQPPPPQTRESNTLNPPPKAYFSDPVSNSISTSSSTSSDVELGGGRGKRKRKWEDFFKKLMREVNEKQEEMQKKFLEAIDKREHERLVREEAWRMQEMARINREHEIIAQERSMAAAKDATVISFLQKISEHQNPGQPVQPPLPAHPQPVPAQQQPTPTPPPQQVVAPSKEDGSGRKYNQNPRIVEVSSSRWPKVEIEALIKIRTNLDSKYQENAPKGPLWEEISAAMKRFGYNRNAKRCKEKWENINKYFKKVKESNKKRPEDSKTCPYFYQLDALYREKDKLYGTSGSVMKAENSVPLMVRPEQQWPPPLGSSHPSSEPEHRHDLGLEEMESERDDDGGDGEEDDGGDRFEIVASKRVTDRKSVV